MLKSLFVLCVASSVLFADTFADSIETYDASESSAVASANSSSYSSSQTRDGSSSSYSSSSSSSSASSNSSSISCITAKCGKNQRLVKCPSSLCVPFTCDQLGKPIACPRFANGRCPDKPACVCIEGYVRNSKGVCIPKGQCPSCGGDCNAQAGCGYLCSEQCGSTKPVPKNCPCEINGCVCKPGFIYDGQQRKCVKRGNCSKQCKKNEVYTSCANGGCGKWNCTQYDEPILCIDPIECIGGCICKTDYLRAPNGTCIPQDQCPSVLCQKPNEVYDPCILACPPRKCGIDDRAVLCLADQPCQPPGCRCKDGYYRNDDGICVTWEECPIPLQCGLNEVESCVHACPPEQTCRNRGLVYSCAYDGRPCTPKCVCADGYYRNAIGECITEAQCDQCQKPNEFYSCNSACDNECDSIATQNRTNCPIKNIKCNKWCYCDDGYARDKKRNCVPVSECPPDTGTPTYTCDDSVEQLLADGNYIWTGQFMHEAITKKPNESTIMSAMSVLVPIAELALYSEGDTYNQLIKTLNLRSKDDIRCVFPRLISRLRAEQNIVLNIANRIFSTDEYPLSNNFLEDTKEVFDAVAESLDFNQPQAAADRINTWVANETNDRIKDIATPDMFNSDTRLVLANAIYFLGNWITQFNVNNTEDRPFHVNNQKTIQIPTMYQQSSFKYGENQNLDCKILEMFYKGGNFSFVIYLPNTVEGLPTLVEQLKEPSAFFDSYGATSYEKVQVYLPKIKTESEFDLSEIMRNAGMQDIFDRSKSNLSGILENYEPLYVSAAKQKAFGLVDEKGTEAAAANIIVVSTTSAIYPPPVIYLFEAKQPFAFYIMYGRLPIFSGTFYGDSQP